MASGLALVWFALGFVGTAVGAIAFLGAGWTEPDPWKRRFYHLAAGAAGGMAVAYLIAVLGVGRVSVGPVEARRSAFWARAVAWTAVAPAFVFGLGRLAGAEETGIRRGAAVAAGVPAASLVAALFPRGVLSWTAWAAAVACLAGFLAVLYTSIGSKASRRHRSVRAAYGSVRTTLVFALAAGVTVSVVGSAGVGVLPDGIAAPLWVAIDAGGVVLVGFFLCRSRAVLHWARPDDASSPAPEDAGSATD